LDKTFSEFVMVASKAVPLLAYFRMRQKVIGLGIPAPQELVDEYSKLLEKLRAMFTEPLAQFNEELR
jgi:hypothetical protein